MFFVGKILWVEYPPIGIPAYAILSPTVKFDTLGPSSLIIPEASIPNPEGNFKGYKPDL